MVKSHPHSNAKMMLAARMRNKKSVTLLETVTDLPSLNGNELDDLTLAPPSPPQFKTENSSIVVSQTGSTAFIPCLVTNLGEGTVSKLNWSLAIREYSVHTLFGDQLR
ncbi:hypothetical protein WDU94_014082 [Cyamophila willieti]